MEFFAPYAIDDLMHFTRMGSPANVVLPLLMLAAFVDRSSSCCGEGRIAASCW